MLYQTMLSQVKNQRVTFTLVGANGQFGRSLLSQIVRVPSVAPAVLCDTQLESLRDFLLGAGFAAEDIVQAGSAEELAEALAAAKTVITDSTELAIAARSQVLIEATGIPALGIDIVSRAIAAGSHIVMVNKEADSVGGIALARKARQRGLNYVLAHGDQPRNLIELIAWATLLGFEIIAAGKSSEYDYVFQEHSGELSFLDQRVAADELRSVWQLGDDVGAVLKRRSEILSELPQATAPDYGEMSLVANAVGLPPSKPEFHYPLARIPELADIYIPKEDGGILERTGVLDVFNLLRRDDEPSFGGGVFVVVRARDAGVWDILAGKGHVVSRKRDYACIYLPYHYMGLETPVTILDAALNDVESHVFSAPERRTVVVAETLRPFTKGEFLAVEGGHHEIDGTRALLMEWHEGLDAIPYYLAGDNALAVDVPAGTVLTESMIVFEDTTLLEHWRER